MPRPTDLVAHKDRLDRRYGEPGTPRREAFQREVDFKVAGELLRQAREAQGLTQTELGERLGVGRSQVSKIEKDLKDMRLSTLIKAFEALGMKASFKVERAGAAL